MRNASLWRDATEAQDYDDPPPPARLVEQRELRARKSHGCDACPGPIQPGSRYRRWLYAGEDGLEVYRQHVPGECVTDAEIEAWEAQEQAERDRAMEEVFAAWAEEERR